MKNVILESLKNGLRFQTSRGPLSTEQLFQLPMKEFATAVEAQYNIVKGASSETEELAFLGSTVSKIDPIEQLKFDVMKEIFTNRKEELDAIRNAAADKVRRDKILNRVAELEDQDFLKLSKEELLDQLK